MKIYRTFAYQRETCLKARIKHSGIVEDITSGGCVRVRITQQAACIGCKIAGHCSTSERKDKIIDVYGAGKGHSYTVGQEVTVSVAERTGLEAVTVAFTLPFLLLIVTVFVVMLLTGDEAVSALLGIGILVPYYAVVYLLRSRLTRRLSFAIDD